MFTCGGTGGHINPALAVAGTIREKRPNDDILFVGVKGGMEERLVPKEGYKTELIETSGIDRKKSLSGLVKNIKTVKNLLSAEREAKKIIEDFSPDVVFGTGGYACFPVLSAAARMNIPTLVHESNAYPGLAARVLAPRLSRVLLNYAVSAEYISKRASCVVVGNPVRGDILMYDRTRARRELGLDERPLLVSFWGSLGAREMNIKTAGFIKLESENGGEFYHIHAAGKFGYKWLSDMIFENGVDLEKNKYITVREYIDDMPRVLAAADLVMCRGGASTLSEITSVGKPAIIVPSPNVTDNHQLKNAEELRKYGGAVVIEEKDATPEVMYSTARKLLENEPKRAEMSAKLTENAVLDSAERIYAEIMKLAVKNRI